MKEIIPSALEGERLDRVVALLSGRSRSEVEIAIEQGLVQIDNVPIFKPSFRVKADSELVAEVAETESETLIPDSSVSFNVVFEDQDIIVVEKPAHVVVHPGAGVNSATLAHGLLARFPEIAEIGQADRPGIVHRLDVGTSGLLVVARNAEAYDYLVNELSQRKIHREYMALVVGNLESDAGEIDAPVGRSMKNRTRMAVSSEGRDARTRYVVQERFNSPIVCTLVGCELETGRTHQIRVHFAAIEHPVVGDAQYGGERSALPASRPILHARRLAFSHPRTGEIVEFLSDIPDDIAAVIALCQA